MNRSRFSFVSIVFAVLTLVASVVIPGRLLAAGEVLVQDWSFSPVTKPAVQGAFVTWKWVGEDDHNVTERSGMNLFASGDRETGTFAYKFTAAGIYAYWCTRHTPDMAGKVSVPVKAAPASGTTATSFTVTWASAAAASGYVYDVQIKRPGSTTWVALKTGVTTNTAVYKATAGVGKYYFRARLRKPAVNKFSGWSSAKAITVS